MSSALHINNNDVGRGSEYFMIESFVNPTKRLFTSVFHRYPTSSTTHLPDTVGTNTCGAAKYGRRTTDASVVNALRLTDCTMIS